MLGAGIVIEGEACQVNVSTSVQALHYRRYCGKSSGITISAYAVRAPDALLCEAIIPQRSEERWHAALLSTLITRYDVRISERSPAQLPIDLDRALVDSGYGECMDSFFA